MPVHSCPGCGKTTITSCFGDPSDLLCESCKLAEINKPELVQPPLGWGKSEPSDSAALPPEGAFILVGLPDKSVRVVRVTKHADKAGGHNRAHVCYPDGTSDCVVEHVMKEIPYTEEGRIALEYLFECARKEAQVSEKLFGLLKSICREINQRDLIAPDFFREHDSRPTTDMEMAENIIKYIQRFKPVK